MNNVFIPDIPTRYDKATDSRIPSIDLNPASQFGELVPMSSSGNPNEVQMEEVRETASRVGPEDYVLCVGDIVLTALAIASVCAVNGSVRLLRWDRESRSYNVVTVELGL